MKISTMTSEQALQQLRECLCRELSETVTSVTIFINADETKISTSHRTKEQLSKSGISMRNIQGNFIK